LLLEKFEFLEEDEDIEKIQKNKYFSKNINLFESKFHHWNLSIENKNSSIGKINNFFENNKSKNDEIRSFVNEISLNQNKENIFNEIKKEDIKTYKHDEMQNKHVNNLKAENLINMEKEKFPFTTKNI